MNIAVSLFREKGTLRDISEYVNKGDKKVNRKLESFTYKLTHKKRLTILFLF